MPWYKTGTVSVVQNSSSVIGTGTSFVAAVRVGDEFRGPDGVGYEITNVASDVAISIDPPYMGPTRSGGSYAVKPVQGYVKDSADALRALVNKFGPQLASLGDLTVSTFGRSLIDDASAATARTTLQLGSAAVAPIVGSVSQSGGVPTGAILERGSNASGEFTKYADGTLICRRLNGYPSACAGAVQSLFVGAAINFVFPHPFAGTPPHVIPLAGRSSVTAGQCWGYLPNTDVTLTAVDVNIIGTALNSTAYMGYFAIGRWFQ